jgi:hypothetical protein
MNTLTVKRVTPILVVDSIEPVVTFWTERLCFTKTIEVPHGPHLGFVAFERGKEQVMLQTKASLLHDLPAIAKLGVSSFLYVEVEAIDGAVRAMQGADLLVPLRTTPYGAREIFVRAPDGQIVGFAQHGS